jgi:hypothetical protein
MTAKTLFIASALLLSLTSASRARYVHHGFGHDGGYYDSYRGGPGPRVGSGQGAGAGSQR